MNMPVRELKIKPPRAKAAFEPCTYCPSVDLTDYFQRSEVSHIYFDKLVLDTVNELLNESLQESPVKEVGGFLLGTISEKIPHQLSVQAFVVARNVVSNSSAHLNFGREPLLQLDRFMEKNNHLSLLGWLHTHPGSGPYLSTTDLNRVQPFFKQNYQVAIVIDPCTAEWDTGIFSWKKEGMINNRKDLKELIKWKSLG